MDMLRDGAGASAIKDGKDTLTNMSASLERPGLAKLDRATGKLTFRDGDFFISTSVMPLDWHEGKYRLKRHALLGTLHASYDIQSRRSKLHPES